VWDLSTLSEYEDQTGALLEQSIENLEIAFVVNQERMHGTQQAMTTTSAVDEMQEIMRSILSQLRGLQEEGSSKYSSTKVHQVCLTHPQFAARNCM